ncbi:MAG: DMT family transporter [Promethearchaeota archaeon]
MNSSLNPDRKSEIIAYILLILTMVIWGGTWPLGRWLVSEEVGGETIPPMMIAAIRYLVVIICFFFILRYQEGTFNFQFAKENWKILTIMGLTSVTIYQAGYLIGEIYTAASDASILVTTNAIWVIILASAFLKTEYFTWKKALGTLLAIVGVITIVGFSPNIDVPNRILGDMLILIGAFAYATYTVFLRSFLTKKNRAESYQPTSLWIITWVSFCGFLTTIPISLLLSPEFLNPFEYFTIPVRVWLGIAYLAFLSSVVGYTFYLEGVKRLDASRAAIFQTLVPLFGVILSVLYLNERFDVFIHSLAFLLVISGITLVNRDMSHSKKKKVH